MKQINCNDKLDEDEISGTVVDNAGTAVGVSANEANDTQINTSALIDAVVESYENTASFKKTAAELKISTAKVRKALLTAGVWTNETAESIAKEREAHHDWSDQQIADELYISLNAVQMYTPYKLGPYTGDSASAERNARYREKNRAGADRVDMSRKELAGIMEQKVEKESLPYAATTHPYPINTQPNASNQKSDEAADIDVVDPFDLPLEAFAQIDTNTSGASGRTEKLGRHDDPGSPWEPGYFEKLAAKELAAGLPFSRYRHNNDPDAMPHVDDQFYLNYRLVEHASYQGRHISDPDVFKLRLEVDTEGMSTDELEILHQEYGVRSGWTRELLVPAHIPLHYFHYVIQRAFGFENKADHLFQLPESVFENLIREGGMGEGGTLRTYARLCGVLFRFPFENTAELYWDDDYDGKKSIRTWLKDKYNDTWNTDAGTGYSYADNQYRIWKWLGDRVIDFHKLDPALDSHTSEEMLDRLAELGAPEEYSLGKMNGAGLCDVEGCQFPFNNVLESLSLAQLMLLQSEEITAWDFEDNLEVAESELLDEMLTLEKAQQALKDADDVYRVMQARMRAGRWEEDTILTKRWREHADKAANLFMLCRGGADVPYSFTNELIYLYDFGCKKGAFGCAGEDCGDEHSDYSYDCGDSVFDNASGDVLPKWKIRIKLEDAFYDYSEYYSRNIQPRDANGVDFYKDPEHGTEMAERLIKMCHWKEKLEILDDADREIRPSNESDMMLELKPEQIMLPEERAEIEEYKAEQEEIQQRRAEWWGEEIKPHTVVIDDKLYAALKTVMTEWVPVCIGKEGADPGEGYPDVKIRNSSIEKQV